LPFPKSFSARLIFALEYVYRSILVCCGKVVVFRRVEVLPRQEVASAGSNRSGSGGNEAVGTFDAKGRKSGSAKVQAVTRVNVEQASKSVTWKLTRLVYGESRCRRMFEATHRFLRFHRGNDDGMHRRKQQQPQETPGGDGSRQPDAREGQAGLRGVAERFVVAMKPGNSGGAKGPQFKSERLQEESSR
jgi:hypothetical protein